MEKDIFRGARLSTIIPADTVRSISEIIEEQDDDQDGDELVPLRKQRDVLFFDETLTVYIVLKLFIGTTDLLESYLSNLELKIDAWVINLPDVARDNTSHRVSSEGSQRELIFSDQVKKSDDPIVIIREDEDGSDGQLTALLLWETSVTLHRPRVRFPNAAISMAPRGTFTSERTARSDDDDEYLPSFVPTQANVLESLKHMRGFENNPPYLATSRLHRVLPDTVATETAVRLPYLPSPPIRVVPAMIGRVRCSRVNAPAALKPSTIAALEVEIIPFMEIRASLEKVEVSLDKGVAEPLGLPPIPVACRSRDAMAFLYRLQPPQPPLESMSIGILSISLDMKVHVSANCTAAISMDWTTNVDLSPSLNPLYGPPSQPIQRPQRPPSLTINSSDPTAHLTTSGPTNLQPSPLSHSSTGLRISFTAPTDPIILGVPFTWSVLVVNHSPKTAKLALIPVPHIQRATTPQQQHNKTHAPKTSTASFHPSEKRHLSAHTPADTDLAQAVCDENIVYALQHSNATPAATDILSLTAEIRVGPLGPGACHECEIRMVALRRGALMVDAVRVVDLVKEAEDGPGAPGVVTDVRELPDVIVV